MKALLPYPTLAAIALLLLGTLQSCDRSGLICVRGNGNLDTESRLIGEYSAVASSGNFDIVIVQGAGGMAEIEAESNLLKHIETKVDRGTLQIGTVDNQCINEQERIRIELTVASLAGVLQNGSGYIFCDSLSTTDFNAQITGSGDVEMRVFANSLDASVAGSGNMTLRGTAPTADLATTGSGPVDALDLHTQICDVRSRGSGNIWTHCDSLLDVTITGSGDVFYTGNPTITERITGSGTLEIY